MKALKSIILFLPVIITAFMMHACKEDDIEVPQASTQADFDFTINEMIIDEEIDSVNWQLEFTNKSILAQSYSWDFGNGETSTEENPAVLLTQAGKYTISLAVTPLNDVYYNRLSKTVSLALGKQVLLFEDFNEGIDFLQEDSWAPEGWQAIDKDGDGVNWYVGERQGVLSMRSQSWDGSPLEPDNWLITPEINLTDFNEGASITFNYDVGITASTPQYRQEHYGIFVSVGSDNPDNFELLFEETFDTETSSWTPHEREIDLSAYAGQIIYVAIRHYNITDMDRIFISEVELFAIE
jgi:hypothetical protein